MAHAVLDDPGVISIPFAFIALIVVSLMTQKDNEGLKSIEDTSAA